MKKALILITINIVLLISIFKVSVSSAADSPRPIYTKESSSCLTFLVSFNASHFNGQSIQVGCQGLRIPQGKTAKDSPCSGNLITIRPGQQNVPITNCACPFNAKGDPKPWADGCLYVAQKLNRITDTSRLNRPGISLNQALPKNCQINTNKFENVKNDNGKNITGYYKTNTNYCGKNGQRKQIPISLTCPGNSPTPTNTSTPTPTTPVIITPTNTPTPTITSTETPTPTGVCVPPAQVANVKITCPNCSGQPTPTPIIICAGDGSDQPGCAEPSPTPTQEPTPTLELSTLTPTDTPTPTGGNQ